MVDGSTRLGVFLKILLPLMGPGLVATSVFAFITTWNEYIFARVLLNDQSKQTRHGLALVLPRHEPPHRLGRADGRLDADRDPGRRLLPARPAQDRVRADRRGGARMSELESSRRACVFPSFPGADAARLGAALPRRRRRRDRALRLQRRHRASALASLCAALRAERADVLLAIDEEGGDVTRLEWRHGQLVPGRRGARRGRRPGADRGGRGVRSRPSSPPSASTGTSRRSPT